MTERSRVLRKGQTKLQAYARGTMKWKARQITGMSFHGSEPLLPTRLRNVRNSFGKHKEVEQM